MERRSNRGNRLEKQRVDSVRLGNLRRFALRPVANAGSGGVERLRRAGSDVRERAKDRRYRRRRRLSQLPDFERDDELRRRMR